MSLLQALGVAVGISGSVVAVWLAWMVATAPLGWEDDQGFHTGEPDEHSHPDNLGI